MFLQIDTIILGLCVARHAQIAQNNKFVISLQYVLKKWVAKLIFHMQISMKVSWKLVVLILMEIVKHSQNCKFTTSLQYLKKKKKKKKKRRWFLHADKHQSFLQLDFNTLGIFVQGGSIIIDRHDQAFSKY